VDCCTHHYLGSLQVTQKLHIIALDLGGVSAYAVNVPGWVATGHWDVTRGRKALRPERLGEFAAHLELQLMMMGALDVLIYERPFARGADATRSLWGYAGIAESLGHKYGAAVLDLTPNQIKLWAAGNARASKTDMLVAARRMGYDGENEHEADAYCLMMYAHTKAIQTPVKKPRKPRNDRNTHGRRTRGAPTSS